MTLPSDTSFWVIAGLVVFLSGVSKGGLAAGFTSLSIPFMSIYVSPVIAATLILPLLCMIDAGVILRYYKQVDWPLVQRLIPGSIVGIVVGSLVFEMVPPYAIKIIVALIAFWFCSLHYLGRYISGPEIKTNAAIFFAALSGFTSSIAHSGGPPIRAYLLSQNLEKSTFIATFGLTFAIINYLKLISYTALGLFNRDILLASLSLLPLVPIGLFVGFWIHTRVSQSYFTKISYFFLLIAAARLMYDGVSTFVSTI
jgi:uncharacterized membrane protein YfcA